MQAPPHSSRARAFLALLQSRLVILDGAMGTMIQQHALNEQQFRGERFAAWRTDLRGNNDLLSITQPNIIAGIHREYLLAGADVISTNTFNSSAVSQADYGLQSLVGELNAEAARLTPVRWASWSSDMSRRRRCSRRLAATRAVSSAAPTSSPGGMGVSRSELPFGAASEAVFFVLVAIFGIGREGSTTPRAPGHRRAVY